MSNATQLITAIPLRGTYRSVDVDLGPGVQVNKDDDENEDDAEGWERDREDLVLILEELLLTFLALTSVLLGFAL